MFIYWLSLHFPSMHMLFFPTLGAFSFLFLSRALNITEFSKIAIGAVLSSIIGTALFLISPGMLSLFANILITIWLINKFKWNAPPILAVSLIPFFAHPDQLWAIPISVFGAMSGLLLTLVIACAVEDRVRGWSVFLLRRKDLAKTEAK
jgi:hypothetical protein